MEEKALTAQQETKLREIAGEYRESPGALLWVLEKAREACGHLPVAALEIIADGLDIPLSKVAGTRDFYPHLSGPQCGTYVIRLCGSAPCGLNGAKATLKALEETLGIKVGETTPDGKFTLQTNDCLGICDKAPAVMVNNEIYGPVHSEEVPGFLAGFEP